MYLTLSCSCYICLLKYSWKEMASPRFGPVDLQCVKSLKTEVITTCTMKPLLDFHNVVVELSNIVATRGAIFLP